MKKFYVTTAIDYPNGSPHLGHAYEKVLADVYSRWYKNLGYKTFFLTGTDENGQKLVEAAKQQNITTKELVDKNSIIFKDLCRKVNSNYSDFIRTTDKRHVDTCQKIWKKLDNQKDIYYGSYSGNYCLDCESFYTELQSQNNHCPSHLKPLIKKEESGYFFKLSKYQDWILNHIKSNTNFIVPKSASLEIIARLENEPLRDLPISRPNNGWGIEVPNDSKFVMYTWFDALINYYSAIAETDNKDFWEADIHLIGKDINWFHSVIWAIILHACKMPIQKQNLVHGMILSENGTKMSKSLGNVIDPFELLNKYSVDSVRYSLLKSLPGFNDGIFSEKDLVERNNNDLANTLGNLIQRVIKLQRKNNDTISGNGIKQEIFFDKCFEEMKSYMEQREHNKALDTLFDQIRAINQYINLNEPWKITSDPLKYSTIMYNCVFSIHVIGVLINSFLPDTSNKILTIISQELNQFDKISFGETYFLLEPEILFTKIKC